MNENMDLWEVYEVEAVNQDDGTEFVFTNVIPTFGKEHTKLPSCWCEPEVSDEGTDENGKNLAIISHSPSH